ncbi:MAG: hypothetical protein H6835_10640 [Planctomycetes bacterium]|nr:hypothetical protein [Planctomycetota bacterium]
MLIAPLLRSGLAAAAFAATTAAQSFPSADLYLFSPALTGIGSGSGGLLRVEMATGTGTLLRNFQTTPQSQDALAFDPYRNALVFMAGIAPLPNILLWQCDGSGRTQSLGYPNRSFAAFAPTGNGRIYLADRAESPAGRIHYLDAANQYQTLMDAAGAVPFEFFPGQATQYAAMIYHASTNALFVAQQAGLSPACGGTTASTGLIVRKVPLSVDGSRAIGPVSCVEFEVSSSGEVPVGIDALPGGDLLVVVDTNSNAAEPRMVRIDPVAMTASTWASNGSYTGAAATNAGCYSGSAGAVVVLDTFADVLRSFTAGQAGLGTVLPSSVPVSAAGASGEAATLAEWRGAACAGYLQSYGAGLNGSGNIAPVLVGNGCPVPGATLDLHVSSALGGGVGVLGFGVFQIAVPLFGGTLLTTPDVITTILLGGTPFASGQGAVTVPFAVPADPAVSGLQLFAQGAVLDPGAIQGVSLTSGLQIVIG